MSEIRGTSPEEYAGAFQHFEEIPYRYRLETYESQYQGRNTWENTQRMLFSPSMTQI